MKKILLFIRKLIKRANNIFYVGSSDILPPPLERDEEINE